MPIKNPHPLYSIWQGMRRRCLSPTFKQWDDYGGRGIRICPEWDSFAQFVEDMGPRPSKSHSIDRIDCNGHYEPSNCRWATRKEQQSNTRRTRFVTIEGQIYRAWELQNEYGVKADTIVDRAAAGLPFDKVISRERVRAFKGSWRWAIAASAEKRRNRTHCKHGHLWTPENTGHETKGRYCRTCHREKVARQREEKRRLAATNAPT